MRCPNCEKFVSLENGDPEIEQFDVQFNPDGEKSSFSVTACVRTTRTCADCSDTMKELQRDMDESFPLSKFEGWDKLSEDHRKRVVELLERKEIEAEESHEDGEVSEGGGGRFKKNMLTLTLPFTLEIDLGGQPEDEGKVAWPVSKLTLNAELTDEQAAGSYEECC